MEETSTTESAADAGTMERKRAAMLERLSNRHNSRASGKQDLSSSATDLFLSRFSESKGSIESKISEIRSDPDPTRKPDLDAIALEISALEKLVAENSYILPAYEVRTCLYTVTHLKQFLDDATTLIVPKKKFSFKNKSSKKSVPAQKDALVAEPEKAPITGLGRLGLSVSNSAPGFRNRTNEELTKEFNRSEEDGQIGEFTLSDLWDCEIKLKGCLRALFVDKLTNCKVYVGAVMGSVLIEGAEGCVFVLAAHQIRIHNAKDCDFYLRVRSRPIIEDSSGVRFAPFCLGYQGIEEDLTRANLVGETGNWANVDDFRWLRAVPSPNWSVLGEDERIGVVDISGVRAL